MTDENSFFSTLEKMCFREANCCGLSKLQYSIQRRQFLRLFQMTFPILYATGIKTCIATTVVLIGHSVFWWRYNTDCQRDTKPAHAFNHHPQPQLYPSSSPHILSTPSHPSHRHIGCSCPRLLKRTTHIANLPQKFVTSPKQADCQSAR